MTDLSKPVQWIEGERHHVGTVAIVRYAPALTGHAHMLFSPDRVLVKHSHTGELEYVHKERLSNYPSEPISEPTK